MKRFFRDNTHDLPDPDKLQLANVKGGELTTDTCAQARANKKLVVEKIIELMDSWEITEVNNIGKLLCTLFTVLSTQIFNRAYNR